MLIDIHEYVTRLANLHSTYGISFGINPKPFEIEKYLSNESYLNDPSAITFCNELCLQERNGH